MVCHVQVFFYVCHTNLLINCVFEFVLFISVYLLRALIRSAAFSATAYMVACK